MSLKVKNTLPKWIWRNIFQNQTLQRTVYHGQFLQKDFRKGIVILVKVDEMYKILKVC